LFAGGLAAFHPYAEPLAFWIRSRERLTDRISFRRHRFVFSPAPDTNISGGLSRCLRPARSDDQRLRGPVRRDESPSHDIFRRTKPIMLFNSFTFLIFFPVVVAIYFVIPHRFRWAWLLAASCYFYMAFIPVYILILFFTIAVDYVAGILIEDAEGRRRKMFLLMSIVANVGVLAIFKYFNS
jgi:hypothetical protein